MKKLFNNNIILAVLLLTVLAISSMPANAQSSRHALDQKIRQKVHRWEDSVRRLKQRKMTTYLGGSLSLSFPQYTLKSKIEALNGLSVSYMGTNVGGVWGTSRFKLKANAGLYYSNASVPYDFEMVQGSISGNIYFLRLKEIKYHSFEPYVRFGVTHQVTKYSGNYLPSESSTSSGSNYSSTDQPLLNVSQYNQLNTGMGVEYQLESCNKLFVHLFAEVNYGVLISSRATNVAFNKTVMQNPTSFSIGINFGIIK